MQLRFANRRCPSIFLILHTFWTWRLLHLDEEDGNSETWYTKFLQHYLIWKCTTAKCTEILEIPSSNYMIGEITSNLLKFRACPMMIGGSLLYSVGYYELLVLIHKLRDFLLQWQILDIYECSITFWGVLCLPVKEDFEEDLHCCTFCTWMWTIVCFVLLFLEIFTQIYL